MYCTVCSKELWGSKDHGIGSVSKEPGRIVKRGSEGVEEAKEVGRVGRFLERVGGGRVGTHLHQPRLFPGYHRGLCVPTPQFRLGGFLQHGRLCGSGSLRQHYHNGSRGRFRARSRSHKGSQERGWTRSDQVKTGHFKLDGGLIHHKSVDGDGGSHYSELSKKEALVAGH
ncbi:hypothetical protein Pmani_031636 [Petrolisthes manimaculis]|uniref:Uncharacterized protein n=1 Tax=Petrolisthes manimaculis TaxID=1843537 RepID=A0AAE1NVA4_9EUCA|nr:hypothetical protein Pmani_031636 [Petrolisthes manimaculis]